MRALVLMLALAVSAQAEQVSVLKDFANSGFQFAYGSWEKNVVVGPEFVSIKPPATDSGGAGVSVANKAISAEAKIRLTLRVTPENQTSQINVVLQDQDGVQGKEGFVYYFALSGVATGEFVAVEKRVSEPDTTDSTIDGMPNFSATDGGLVGWQLQGNHSMGDVMSVEVKKIEIVEP